MDKIKNIIDIQIGTVMGGDGKKNVDIKTKEKLNNVENIDIMPGDKITWTSQAAGYTKTKTGIFLGVVNPEKDAYKYVPRKLRDSSTRIKGQNHSSIVRAAVEVSRGVGKDSDYYFPRLTAIKKVE